MPNSRNHSVHLINRLLGMPEFLQIKALTFPNLHKALVASMIFLFFATACGIVDRSTSEKLPGIDIPIEDMNVKARLYAPPEANDFKIGKGVGVVLENLTNIPMILPQDYGVTLFAKQGDKWVPIQNDFGYPAGETRVLPKDQEQFGGVMIDTYPSVRGTQSISIRVVVIGRLEGTTNEKIAAYTDVTLNP